MKISELKKTDYATKKEYKAAVSGLYEKIADAFAVANKKDAASAINPSIITVKSGAELLSKDSQAFAKQAVTFANDVVDKSASVFDRVQKSVTKSSFGDVAEKNREESERSQVCFFFGSDSFYFLIYDCDTENLFKKQDLSGVRRAD